MCSIPIISELTAPYELLSWKGKIEWPRHSTYDHDILPIQNRHFLPTTTFYLYRTDIFFLPRHSTYTEQTFSSYHDILPIQNRHFLPIWCAWLLETPSYQWFQSYHGKNKLLLMKWWWFLFFLDDELSFYSARSWK